jgi:hypothetical protein
MAQNIPLRLFPMKSLLSGHGRLHALSGGSSGDFLSLWRCLRINKNAIFMHEKWQQTAPSDSIPPRPLRQKMGKTCADAIRQAT